MSQKIPGNAMYLGMNIRIRKKSTPCLERKKIGLESEESFYTCQDMYSALNPIKDPGDPTVKTTKFYPEDK